MSAQWPLVAGRLLTLLPTLPNWSTTVQLFNGAAFDVSSATFATIGHATDGANTQRGNYTKTQSPDGVRYAEQGSVACQLATQDSDNDITDSTTLLFTVMDDLEAAIRADRTLGVLSQEGTTDLTVEVGSDQAIPGATANLVFTVSYFTVT